MTALAAIGRIKIHPGKLTEFKDLASQCVASVKEKDTHTLQYDWYLNEDQSECVVHEKYTDSGAVLEHVGNLGDLFGKIIQTGDFSVEIFGNPSEELKKLTASMNPKIYTFWKGL